MLPESGYSLAVKDVATMSAADPETKTTLPVDSDLRKRVPLFRGLLRYFPAALAKVAEVSLVGNEKHNPGQELHHARGKSTDQADCILRHLVDLSEDYGKGVGRDQDGVPQVAYIAWRALALAQEWLEKNDGAPLAPGAKEPMTEAELATGIMGAQFISQDAYEQLKDSFMSGFDRKAKKVSR